MSKHPDLGEKQHTYMCVVSGCCFCLTREPSTRSHLRSGNVYTNKVVLLDEAHNLCRSETRYWVALSGILQLCLDTGLF